MSVEPISPNEVNEAKKLLVPDWVIKAFNFLLAKNWNGSCARITQEEAICECMHLGHVSRSDLFRNNWLDIEEIYRTKGWIVKYYKPAYHSLDKPFWTFYKTPPIE